MNGNSLFLIIAIGLLNQTSVAQKSNKNKICFSTTPFDKEKVFTKTLHKPYFIGGNDSLVNFLMSNISFQKVISS